jgi:hypothetical protein
VWYCKAEGGHLSPVWPPRAQYLSEGQHHLGGKWQWDRLSLARRPRSLSRRQKQRAGCNIGSLVIGVRSHVNVAYRDYRGGLSTSERGKGVEVKAETYLHPP